MSFLFGFVIAGVVGLTGIGAGSITAPVLMLVFGQSPASAVGTALLFTVAIKLFAAPIYMHRKQVEFSVLAALCLGGIPGTVIGTFALSAFNSRRYERTLLVLIGAIALTLASYALYDLVRRRANQRRSDSRRWLPWMGALLGTESGFSSAGAGALGSLMLLNFTVLTPAQVVGTDLWFGLMVSIVGAGCHLASGNYDSTLFWKLSAGGIVGAAIGARLSSIFSPNALRITIVLLLLGLGLQVCWRGLR